MIIIKLISNKTTILLFLLCFTYANVFAVDNYQRSAKKLLKWQTKQIHEVITIAEAQPDYFISLGFGSNSDSDVAILTAERDACFRIPTIVNTYVETLVRVKNEIKDINNNYEIIDSYINLINTQSKISVRNIKFKVLEQTELDGLIQIAVIAYVKKSDIIENNNEFGTHISSSKRLSSFVVKVEEQFINYYKKKINKIYLINNEE